MVQLGDFIHSAGGGEWKVTDQDDKDCADAKGDVGDGFSGAGIGHAGFGMRPSRPTRAGALDRNKSEQKKRSERVRDQAWGFCTWNEV